MPQISFALTGGPHQPEYTSYEDWGSTDMVNLLTGDFNFNVPLLEVPGPEGGFSVPLSYHAGVSLEQDASWVGLGWNINVGSIVRDFNQYPDDASGEANMVTVQDLTGVNGYDIQWAAPYKQGWNSVEGKYGNVNLLDIVKVQWGKDSYVGILGYHMSSEGDEFKAGEFVSGLMAIMTIGTSAGAQATAGAIAKQTAVQLAIQSGTSLLSAGLSGSSGNGSTAGHWTPSTSNDKSLTFSANPLTGFVGVKNKYKVWLDQTRREDMFGVLYSQDAARTPMYTNQSIGFGGWAGCKVYVNGTLQPTVQSFLQSTGEVNHGSASDVIFPIANLSYQQSNNPVLLASDHYFVNGPGISGNISPYRLEVGSVSMPREMTEKHIRYALVPYLNYKVPFLYDGSPTNQYFHHSGGNSAAPAAPGFNYGVSKIGGGSIEAFGSTYRYTEFDFQDYIFFNERVRADVNATKKVPQGNYVDWMSNAEIQSAVTYPNKFMDFLPGGPSSPRNTFRATSAKGIGGYCVTSTDGKTYHYALPSYEQNDKTESVKVSDPTKRSMITRSAPFANTWLLTAITGPDFIDRNENGMVDVDDWGYWIKFNYGKYGSSFKWRTPYTGTALDPTGTFNNYMEGEKQLYYLNSIETRSHVALFMKSIRQDGKAAGGTMGTQLKLDEIALLKREKYQQLVSMGVNDYAVGTGNMCYTSEFFPERRTFVNNNCLRRILFTQSYELCKGVPNSTLGKLTLDRVSVRGRSDMLMHPDYKFEYANNPNYQSNYWDGWGFYNPQGTASLDSHKSNDPSGSLGSAWSLSRITTPLGTTMTVNYERDRYSSISGEPVYGTAYSLTRQTFSEMVVPAANSTIVRNDTENFSVGEKLSATVNVRCQCPNEQSYTIKDFTATYEVAAVSPTTLTLQGNSINTNVCPGSGAPALVPFDYYFVSYKKETKQKSGGNLRVGSIVVKDDLGEEYKTRYLYDKDDGYSSGVVAQEPEFIKTYDLNFYEYLDYPVTPVVYGRVTVLNGKLSNDADFSSRKVFEFETPHKNQYTQVREDKASTENLNDAYLFKLEDRTAKVGRLKAIRLYDKSGNAVSETALDYTENQITNNDGQPYQGVYSSGTLLFDMFNGSGKTVLNPQGGSNYDYVFLPDLVRVNRTTILRYPSVLKKVTNTKDGFQSEAENLTWDFLTGDVVENITRSSLGINLKTVRVPAFRHTQYSTMGPKAIDPNNKNMLSQIAEEYQYRTDITGTVLNGLTSASVQTWNNDWSNYRYYDGTRYVDQNEPASVSNPVWRTAAQYAWKGDYTRLKTDGTRTFAEADKFNFAAGATNPLWQFSNAIEKFDHYGMPLQSRDLSNRYSAVKMGYMESTVIASAMNAKYDEIAFSSAEDKFLDKPFFGGEVALGTGTVKYVSKGQATTTHTGDAVVSTTLASQKGFVFKPVNLAAGKRYRASAWTNNPNGRIYYRIGTSPTDVLSAAPSAVKSVNGWYRLDVEVPAQAAIYNLEIGVKSTADGEVYFDDFRFQPSDATMECFVFLPGDFDFPAGATRSNWVLDNDNLFTRYEYNSAGMLGKTFQESFKYGIKLMSEEKYNFRRTNVNQ